MKCPICDSKIQDYTKDYMEYTLMEEHASCKDEHHFYAYEYITGNLTEVIGNVSFVSFHGDIGDRRKLQSKQSKAVLELEREYYNNKLKTYNGGI